MFETGFPYSEGGRVKRAIAQTARALNGRRFLGQPFGNRFRGVYCHMPSPSKAAIDRVIGDAETASVRVRMVRERD